MSNCFDCLFSREIAIVHTCNGHGCRTDHILLYRTRLTSYRNNSILYSYESHIQGVYGIHMVNRMVTRMITQMITLWDSYELHMNYIVPFDLHMNLIELHTKC